MSNISLSAKFDRLTYLSLLILCGGLFTAFSLLAVHHVLILISGLYFFKLYRPSLPISAWCLVGLVVTGVLSVIVNEAPVKNILKLKYFLIPVLSLPAYYFFFKQASSKKLKILLWTLLISTSLATISGLIGKFTGFNPLRFKMSCHPDRACGMYGMYMTYGYGINFFVTLMAGLMLYRKKVEHLVPSWIIGSAFIINLAGLYFSYARGAVIGFACSLPLLFLYKGKKAVLKLYAVLGVLSFAAVFSIPQLNDLFFHPDRIWSNQIRISQFKAAFKAFEESPVLGVGYRNFEPQSREIKRRHQIEYDHYQGHAHSNYLEHLASTGVLGFLFLLGFQFFWFWECLKRRDPLGNTIAALVVSFSLSGLFQYTFGDGENLFLLMNAYALSMLPRGKENG